MNELWNHEKSQRGKKTPRKLLTNWAFLIRMILHSMVWWDGEICSEGVACPTWGFLSQANLRGTLGDVCQALCLCVEDLPDYTDHKTVPHDPSQLVMCLGKINRLTCLAPASSILYLGNRKLSLPSLDHCVMWNNSLLEFYKLGSYQLMGHIFPGPWSPPSPATTDLPRNCSQTCLCLGITWVFKESAACLSQPRHPASISLWLWPGHGDIFKAP